MISRFNYVLPKKRDSSKDDIFYTYSYEKKIVVISTQKDGSVDKYEERPFWKKVQNSWKEYIKGFDIGSVSEQIMNHLTKGTPLVTAHTLPAGDYTQLEKGAEISMKMREAGVSLDDIVSAVKMELEQADMKEEKAPEEKGGQE